MNFVTDTHALVWYFTNDRRLGKRALQCFEKTVREGQIIIPTVVLAEILYISRKGRVSLNFSETLAKIETAENIEVAALDLEVLKIADGIECELEMHDRLIVATALCFNASLITCDEQINNSQVVSTIW